MLLKYMFNMELTSYTNIFEGNFHQKKSSPGFARMSMRSTSGLHAATARARHAPSDSPTR